ncbi:putative methyltransferase [Nostocoides japonicum T1-X7]|uniref:Putative methyltransferase n=1 Tax=Nostocoides japonicum T1-X7 TaxID=1194083 RepID=A0A077LUM0_9MICO|nr:class I SAM-dependent methyltransferase [Tetrasphaera japonica]CCH77236.1 putative methyltransferase [Tetrasphaera japonica T1-X7]
MGLYGRFFAAVYDRSVASTEEHGMRERRRSVLASATGRVLEIGAGTGLNLPLYPSSIEQLTLSDPQEPMLRRLRRRVRELHRQVDTVQAPAERLPFPEGAFDTVVSTLALCTVDDLPQALGEIRRVLSSSGRLVVVEHVRSDDARVAGWQDRLHTPWRFFANGCHVNRDTRAALALAGFDVSELRGEEWTGAPALARPLIVGVATLP